MEKTQLVICPSKKTRGDAVYVILVAETGEGLASHLCSSAAYAKGDLYSNRKERIKEWKDRFGEVKVDFIDDIDLDESVLLERNQQFHKER